MGYNPSSFDDSPEDGMSSFVAMHLRDNGGGSQVDDRMECPECGKDVKRKADGGAWAHKCEPKAKPAPAASAGTSPGTVTADRVIAAYIKTRDEIAELSKEEKRLKAIQEKRELWLAGNMDQTKEIGKKTLEGSCHFYKFVSVTVADPEEYKAWIHEDWENRKHFLANAASKEAVTQWVDDGNTPPPGANYVTMRKVRVVRN